MLTVNLGISDSRADFSLNPITRILRRGDGKGVPSSGEVNGHGSEPVSDGGLRRRSPAAAFRLLFVASKIISRPTKRPVHPPSGRSGRRERHHENRRETPSVIDDDRSMEIDTSAAFYYGGYVRRDNIIDLFTRTASAKARELESRIFIYACRV